MELNKYSFGVGDRFTMEGSAQLAAIQEINAMGFDVAPVWNKSYREHQIIKTNHSSVAKEAKEAVAANNYKGNYFVDADHIGLGNVDEFMDYSNFFTIDVAHFISQPVDSALKAAFVQRHAHYIGTLTIPGIDTSFTISSEMLEGIADKYALAIQEVTKIYQHIEAKKGKGNFIPEVSMDETEEAQSPIEMFFILAELKAMGVEVQTVAPKFTGLFPKGVDYQGDVAGFAKEFEEDVAVIKYAIDTLKLPKSLKLSVHSGSDKFSIYPAMRKAIEKFDAGIHVKTAGTTWLEEVIGLAKAGGNGLDIAKEVYAKSLGRFDELTGPYATVLNIDPKELPSAEEVNAWDSVRFAEALVHDQSCANFNSSFRQLIHVGYKIAVEMGDLFQNALVEHRQVIEENVKFNLLERHLKLLLIA